MKKYLVNVTFKNKWNQTILFKAKNNIDLEVKIIKSLKNIFETFDDINGLEYSQIKKYHFNKKEPYYLVGDTYIGAGCFEEILENKKENKNE